MATRAEIGENGIYLEGKHLEDDVFRMLLGKYLGKKGLHPVKSLSRQNTAVFKGEELEEPRYRTELTRFLGFAGLRATPPATAEGQAPDFVKKDAAFITGLTYFQKGIELGYAKRTLSPTIGMLGMHGQDVRRSRSQPYRGNFHTLPYSLPPILILNKHEADILGSPLNEPLISLNDVAESIVMGSIYNVTGIRVTRTHQLEDIISQFEPAGVKPPEL
jgi:hypothetical protein